MRAAGAPAVDEGAAGFAEPDERDLHVMSSLPSGRPGPSRHDSARIPVGACLLPRGRVRWRDLGWHAQFWCDCAALPDLRDRIAALPVPVVIDHFGRIPTDRGADDPGFLTLRDMLVCDEVYCKILGAYRLSPHAPDYPDLRPFADRLITAAPDRLVWGTDWPHPNHAGTMPDDADLLDLLADWCDHDADLLTRILVTTPEHLYA
ncbi:amidohydrolase family protein [Pseudooceanicola sp. LIPI14-2-Ac024]|uniref:amidohydrolase family protein n=1 Tax=Pseudooceanicola sp. LIPI14-2-Ac024 TaxID=3344875 RepID=UPI0035CFAC34